MEQPICLFGPGESYYRPWPREDYQPRRGRGWLRSVLAGMLAIFPWSRRQASRSVIVAQRSCSGPDLLGLLAQKNRDDHIRFLLAELAQTVKTVGSVPIGRRSGESDFAEDRPLWETDYECNTQADGHLASYSGLPAQPWLFSDHAGVGRPPQHQQGYRLSARRGPRRKGAPAEVAAQGTLFGSE